ncbi:MAG: cellulase family glycosylhydrolase [Deltaproteobacteria bacterium]|nr:cellulase family glycosylhydrolase [Deltaproteobacteria bacterium]MBW2393219.1 cellulase family glycosylhydrolase [Deltaproteobacteria bacterium]
MRPLNSHSLTSGSVRRRTAALTGGLALLALTSSLGTQCGPVAPAPSEPRFITDEQGRALILHGMNVSGDAKWDPERMPWVGRDDVLRLSRDWGFNFSRFLITWDGIEPQRGVYDEAYLDRIEERLDWHHEAGLFVVLDMHQDVYGPVDSDGRRMSGNGHPAWSFVTDGEPFPSIPGNWFLSYFTPAITRAFDNFWDYEGSTGWIQQHYLDAWLQVVERFKDHPAVLGYDAINEPWAGSGLAQPDAFSADEFDQGVYQEFLQRFIHMVRSVDQDGWIFYEPRAWGPNSGSPSRIGILDDPRAGDDRLVYFPHLYSLIVDTSGEYPSFDDTVEIWAESRITEINAQKAPMLIGEWGTGQEVVGVDRYLNDVARMADRVTSGWAYWEHGEGGWGILDANGNEKPPADILTRAYPRRVAGYPNQVDYDPERRVMILMYKSRPGVTGPTEIYVPRGRHFPEGFDLRVSHGKWHAAWDAERELITLCAAPQSRLREVIISPAAGPVPLMPPPGVLTTCEFPEEEES